MTSGRMPAAWVKQALVLACVFGVVACLELRPEGKAFFRPLDEMTASMTAMTIRQLGMPVSVDSTLLTHPSGFRFRISYGCTGLVPFAIIVATLSLLPLSGGQRLTGILLGAVLTIGLNLLRLAGLYFIGVHYPYDFVAAHEWWSQVLVVVTTAAFLLYWIHVDPPHSGSPAVNQNRPDRSVTA